MLNEDAQAGKAGVAGQTGKAGVVGQAGQAWSARPAWPSICSGTFIIYPYVQTHPACADRSEGDGFLGGP